MYSIQDNNDLDTFDNETLPNFLKESSKTHSWYHHYTTLETLKKILKNKTFKMTKGASKRLNDLHEADNKGDKSLWERTYITCFNFSGEEELIYKNKEKTDVRIEENMAMWKLYCIPKYEAIRISIPQDTFLDLVKKNCKIDQDKNEIIDENKIDEVFSTDVFYTKGNNEEEYEDPEFQKHIDKNFKIETNGKKLFDYLKSKEFTGCVKNYAWRYENEVRIIATINADCKNILQKDAIFLNFPDNLLKTFVITTGPNFTKFNELKKLLDKYGLKSSITSVLAGNVNFRDPYEEIVESINDLAVKMKKLTKK